MLSALLFDLKTTQEGQESPTFCLEVRPTRRNATNASQLATGPKTARKRSQGHAQPANKQVIRRGTVPKGKGGSCSQDAMTDDRGSGGTLAVPSNEKSISIKELWVVLDMTGKKISFLIDRGATYPVLISHAGPLSSKSCTVTGVDGKPRTHFFTGALTCQFDQRLTSHAFLVVPECHTPPPSELPQGHTPVRRPRIAPYLDSKTSWNIKVLFPAIFYRQWTLQYVTK